MTVGTGLGAKRGKTGLTEREVVGKRIRRIREARRLTLKVVESRAGISATHISEIERGRTSPTMGALLRIAGALDVDPAVLVEEEELSEVSVVTGDDRVRVGRAVDATTTQPLTTTVAGGRIQAHRITLAPRGRSRLEPHAHSGNEASLVVRGRVRFTIGGKAVDLEEGDSIHYAASIPHVFENRSAGEAVVLWISTDRDSR